MRRLSVVALVLLLVPLALARSANASVVIDACSSSVSGDFNGDGNDDLAVGVPFEDVGSLRDAGAVNVIYGSSSGLTATGNQIWTQDTSGIDGVAETGDRFGSCLAAGDFNGDSIADLAIGVPGEDVGSRVDAGAVNIIYGHADLGLVASGTGVPVNHCFHQGADGVTGAPEAGDRFGASLAAGNFNNAEGVDLAIGDPGEDVGSLRDAGAVNVLYGSSTTGLSGTADQIWTQDSPSIEGVAEPGDRFGESLAAGDVNGDGRADLAIGDPGEDVGSIVDAGAVNVLLGSDTDGLTSAQDEIWTQNSAGIADASEKGDLFGDAVALADFDGSGEADLAVGVPRESVTGVGTDAGAFHVIYGSNAGLVSTDSVFVKGTSAGDFLGATLVGGTFNFDAGGMSDLAVGVPGHKVGSETGAGAVGVFYDNDFTTVQVLTQDTTDVEDNAEQGDAFGAALVAGNYDGDNFTDIAIGAPGEDSGATDAGLVNVIYGSVQGLDPSPTVGTADQAWRQGKDGIAGVPEAQDFFAVALG